MLTEPRSGALDLLVVGGLTIDRFADGSSAPGGSVLHATRAAATRDRRVGVVTAAGLEPGSLAAMAELRDLAPLVEVASHDTTSMFRHRDAAGGRRLWLEQAGGPIALDADAVDRIRTHAILYAPVAGEIDVAALRMWDERVTRGAILQGWLRATAEDGEVMHKPLAQLGDRLRETLGSLDLAVASSEDLAAAGPSPANQLTALRGALGGGPALVVTDGANGLWLDVAGDRQHVRLAWLVEDVPTVGAGDILAAFLTMGAKDPPGGWRAHAEGAMRVVVDVLKERKRG